MSNPNMTYEELQSAMQAILARIEPGEVRVSLPDESSYITTTYELAIDELIQLFATLGAEVIGQDENSGVATQSNGEVGPSTNEHLRNHLRAKQRIILAQLTTKNTNKENIK